MKYFYQLEIAPWGLIGAPVECERLDDYRHFPWTERPRFDWEKPIEDNAFIEVRRFVFVLRDKYHRGDGIVGVYCLDHITKNKADEVTKVRR